MFKPHNLRVEVCLQGDEYKGASICSIERIIKPQQDKPLSTVTSQSTTEATVHIVLHIFQHQQDASFSHPYHRSSACYSSITDFGAWSPRNADNGLIHNFEYEASYRSQRFQRHGPGRSFPSCERIPTRPQCICMLNHFLFNMTSTPQPDS
jgi:hypothetical protein